MALSRRAFLGVALPPDDEAFAGNGMRIADNVAGCTPLRAGDVVLAIAGEPVRDLCELAAALRRAGASRQLDIEYERDGVRERCTSAVVEHPREPGVEYGEIVVVGGTRLRMLANVALEPKGIVLYLQGIACESVEQAAIATLARGFGDRYDVVRFDKRGVGDSEGGPCSALDFSTELADARAVFDQLAQQARRRGLGFAVFGHSVGGIVAALLPERGATIVYGAPVMRWLDCLRDSARRQLAVQGAPDSEIAARLEAIDRLAERGALSGRSAAYHAQLDAIDVAAAWRARDERILVLRGEHDWVVDAGDQARIGQLARGQVDMRDLPGLDHLFGRHADRAASLESYGSGIPDDTLASVAASWLDRVL